MSSGFRDLLEIGTQARPRIFDLQIRTPPLLCSDVLEVEEAVILAPAELLATAKIDPHRPGLPRDALGRRIRLAPSTTGEWVLVEKVMK